MTQFEMAEAAIWKKRRGAFEPFNRLSPYFTGKYINDIIYENLTIDEVL
jgi:hypothetical protein